MIQKQKLLATAALVEAWAHARNLINGSDPKSQTLKTVSEFGELAYGVFGEDDALTIDGIGDTLVTQIIVCAQMGVDFGDVISNAMKLGEHPKGTTHQNMLYCMGQLGHMADQVLKNQTDAFAFTLAIFIHHLDNVCEVQEFNIHECLESAYDEIKDRRGVMYNGAFIKESDPAYKGAVAALAASVKEEA